MEGKGIVVKLQGISRTKTENHLFRPHLSKSIKTVRKYLGLTTRKSTKPPRMLAIFDGCLVLCVLWSPWKVAMPRTHAPAVMLPLYTRNAGAAVADVDNTFAFQLQFGSRSKGGRPRSATLAEAVAVAEASVAALVHANLIATKYSERK